MKFAVTSRLAAGALALCALALLTFEAGAQGKGEPSRVPEANAPNLQGRSDATPSPQRPDAQAPDEEAPSANDEAPGLRQGCPDEGRKLELIV